MTLRRKYHFYQFYVNDIIDSENNIELYYFKANLLRENVKDPVFNLFTLLKQKLDTRDNIIEQ